MGYGLPNFGRHELEDESHRVHEMDGKGGNSTVGKAELESGVEKERAELEGKSRKSRRVTAYEMPA